MSFNPFPFDPPTPASLADARRLLNESNSSLAGLDRKIEAAEAQLAQIVADSRGTIKLLQRERAALEDKISRTLAYVSPIRRLPAELLRLIFMMNFDEYPCCAWILSSVCSQWRRLALSMPKLWSKVWYLSQSAFPS
jgi:F-box-like